MAGRRKKVTVVKKLMDAIKFISLAQQGKADNATYCMLHEGYAVAFDGLTAAGCPIDEQLDCCPHTHLFIAALDAASADFQIVQTPDNRLEVSSGEYQASVPCYTGNSLSWCVPNEPIDKCNDDLRTALKVVGELVSDKADLLIAACAIVGNCSVTATDRIVILEAWTGVSIGVDILVPKSFIKALVKTKKTIVGHGYNATSYTVWFDDKSWLQTQIYTEKIPDSRLYLNRAMELEQFKAPTNLIQSVESVLPFSNGKIVTDGQYVRSHGIYSARQAILDVEMPRRVYNGDKLLIAAKYMQMFNAADINYTFFSGGNVRGAIIHEKYFTEDELVTERQAKCVCEIDTDCIKKGCTGKPCCGECIPF